MAATDGVAGDDRNIPAWITFYWQLWPDPYPTPAGPEDDAAWQKEVDRLKIALPVYCSHVSVGDRIPREAVQAVIDSRKAMKKGDLAPDKELWLYFIWTDDDVKFRWELRSDKARGTIRSGGDDLD